MSLSPRLHTAGALIAPLLAAALTAACTSGSSGHGTDAAPPAPVTLSLATYNVKNFFDAEDDPLHEDTVLTPSQVTARIAGIGMALRELDADVVALQEVETLALLQRLVADELPSLGYVEVRLIEGNDVRGIDVALLSRFPLVDITSHANATFKGVDGDTTTYGFSRDCLEVIMEPTTGRRLTLLVNHLRASTFSDPTEGLDRRLAQANHVREIADATFAANPDAYLAVLGDLNDTPESRTLELLLRGTPELFDLLTQLPTAERYTTVWDNQLDYILASPTLRDALEPGTIRVDHANLYSAVSDHYPVIGTFTIR